MSDTLVTAFGNRLRYKTSPKWKKPLIAPWRFTRNQLQKLGAIKHPEGQVRQVNAFHMREFAIVNGEGVGEQIASYGIYEESLTEAFLRILRPGMVVLDVGMHLGYYATLFAKLVGESGEVHAFEPTPSTREIAVRNAARYKHVVVYREALWSSEGMVKFRDYGLKWLAFNSFTDAKTDQDLPPPKQIEVPTTTLDRFREKLLRPISLIKIDAESAEIEILNGAVKTFSIDRPILSVEVGDVGTNFRSRELHDKLAASGYRAWEFYEGRFKLHQPQDKYEYGNLIFAPPDRDLSGF